jgi:hypothetical protein
VVTGKRLILPGQFFEAQSKPMFPHATRTIPIYFHYSGRTLDAVRVKYPEGWKIESVPTKEQMLYAKVVGYNASTGEQANAVVMRRTYDQATTYFLVNEYSGVKSFYDKIAADDQQPVVLIRAAAAAAAPVAAQ